MLKKPKENRREDQVKDSKVRGLPAELGPREKNKTKEIRFGAKGVCVKRKQREKTKGKKKKNKGN